MCLVTTMLMLLLHNTHDSRMHRISWLDARASCGRVFCGLMAVVVLHESAIAFCRHSPVHTVPTAALLLALVLQN